MRICFFGTYDKVRPRNNVFVKALNEKGIYVDECRFDLWSGINDKSRIKITGLLTTYAIRRFAAYFILTFKFFKIKRPDKIIVGYLGHFDVWLAALLGILYKIPVIFLMHISIYDTMVFDRATIRKNSLISKILRLIDWQAIKLARLTIVDTEEDIDYFSEMFRIRSEKFISVPIGADENIFFPSEKEAADINDIERKEKILFYGQFIPLQGIDYIIDAIELLKDRKDIQFIIVGRGQEKESAGRLAAERNLKNITWIDWVDYDKLPDLIRDSDIVLGIFGKTNKANRVIPNKVYQALACGKPLITSGTEAVNKLLTNTESAYLCDIKNPSSLADCVKDLIKNSRTKNKIGENGYAAFKGFCSIEKIGDVVFEILKNKQA